MRDRLPEAGESLRIVSRQGFLKAGGAGLATGVLLGVAGAKAYGGMDANTPSSSSRPGSAGADRNLAAEFPRDEPLVAVRRGEVVENVYKGRLAVSAPEGGGLEAVGDPGGYAYLRSAAKPFQALPLVFSGAADDLGLTDEELAVACGSHAAEERHVAAVRSILEKAGLSEQDLQTPVARPRGPSPGGEETGGGVEPSPVYHQCSGNHAGILALSVHEGWETESYREEDHPAQRLILKTIAQACGLPPEDVVLGGDNCGIPAFAMPLENFATAYARLATGRSLPSEELAGAVERIRGAMRGYPFMVAGTDRLDTKVMQETGLVSKIGADAVYAAGSPEDGWGLALKVSDGETEYSSMVARAALARRGVEGVDSPEPQPLDDLHDEHVGEIEPLL